MNQAVLDKMTDLAEDALQGLTADDVYNVYGDDFYEVFMDAIEEEGFPEGTTLHDIDYSIDVKAKKEARIIAEEYIEANEIRTMEDADMQSEGDVETYIMNDLDNLDFELTLKTDVTDYLDERPTEEYFAEQIEEEFDPIGLRMAIEESELDSLHQKIAEKLREEDYPDHVTPNDIDDFEVTNIRPKTSFDDLASQLFGKIEESGNVSSYLNDGNFVRDAVSEELLDYDVEIYNDKEDFEEDEDEY